MTATTQTEVSAARPAVRAPEAPVGRTTGWWGMVLFIATESATFATVLASYFYLRFSHGGPWPPAADSRPSLPVPVIATATLVLSCATMLLADRANRSDRKAVSVLALVVTLLAGSAFIALQIVDYLGEWPDSTPSKDAYGSLFYGITGLHTLHVVVGVLMLVVLVGSAFVGRLGKEHPGPVHVVAVYWYFLSVVAVAVFLTVYASPYL